MKNFITGHLLGKNADVYCGGDDKFKGVVVACADGVLTLETRKGVYTHIAIDKIIAIWAKFDDRGEKGPSAKNIVKKHK